MSRPLRGAAFSSNAWRGCALLVCLAGTLTSVSIGAHEIGTTRVTVVVRDNGTYDVDLITDATALAEKVEASAGGTLPANADAQRLGLTLTRLEDTLRARISLAFDGTVTRPSMTHSVTPPADKLSAAVARIHLTGTIPSGARQLEWAYGWTYASYALTITRASAGTPVTQWLEGDQRSAPFALDLPGAPADRLGTAWRYLVLGFTHIVPHGLDHMLFVLGIYLLSRRMRSVLLQVSAFTVAHSITLALSMYGIVAVTPRVVEPLIAISIAYVAVENVFLSELRSWRVALVFGFGLLHGMGFAGALQEVGLPRSEFLTALLTFNLGVEAGQLAVIATAFVLVGWQCAHRAWYRQVVVGPASLLIAVTAAYWTVERLVM